MGSAKQSEQEPKRRYDFPCFIVLQKHLHPARTISNTLGEQRMFTNLLASTRACLYRAFSLTRPAVMQIYCLQQMKVWISLGYLETAQPHHPNPCLKTYQNFLSCFLVAAARASLKRPRKAADLICTGTKIFDFYPRCI